MLPWLYVISVHIETDVENGTEPVGQWTNQLFHVCVTKVQCDNFTAVMFDPFYSWLWYDYSHKNMQENKWLC